MNQCLRCSKPCETSAVFCDDCRSLLRNEFRQGSVSRSSDSGSSASPVGTPFIASSLAPSSSAPSLMSTSAPSLVAQEPDNSYSERSRHSTGPQGIAETPRSPGAPVTPHPPVIDGYPYPDNAEQVMSRLNEAAQFISEAEPSNRRLPRASRLAPMRDISADIRRESTPLPKFARMRSNTGASEKASVSGPLEAAQADVQEQNLQDSDLPDLWPWLDNDVEEKESEDTWANSTDPLISRHIPNSIEAARIEEEDIKRALAEGIPTSHELRLVRPRRIFSLRIAFAVLALLAIFALIVDGVLLSVVVNHPKRTTTPPNGPAVPALWLSPNVVTVTKKSGPQQVQVHIMNFTPGHRVQLSHDVQEPVVTVGNSNIVTIGKDGSANATLIIDNDNSWSVGFDQVYAEDIKTHFIASAQLRVIGNDPSLPAHLELLDQYGKPVSSLDFGSNIKGSNTILPLTLKNSGSGSITWSASSNQPWLLVSPAQGIFSQSQKIDVAAQSINLQPGKHTGTLILSSNVSAQPQKIQVTMSVSAAMSGPVLAPTPAVLSFISTDGSQAPPPQPLLLNNPGTQPLTWSLNITASASASNQLALAHMSGISNYWLSADLPSGRTITAGASQSIYVSVNSYSLLPGTYSGELIFSAPGAVDPSQTVAVSLTVQPHCGLVTNSGYLSFTAVQGKTNPSNQSLGLNATASCAGTSISWQAVLSSSGWLSATPTGGTLKGTTSDFISVGANAAGLPAKTYYGFIALTTQNSTQTVMVELIVQLPPAVNAPVMSAAPLNLNFSNTYGQQSPKGQVVTITNSGASPLYWSTNVTQIGPTWLYTTPTGSGLTPVQPGQTGQLVVNIDTSHLSPGSYAGQIGLTGRDSAGKIASGSGQNISINLVVQPACALTQPSLSSLSFSGVQGGFNPISQSLLITGTGNCAWPLTLTASAPSASWLKVQFPTNYTVKGSGQSVVFVVYADISRLVSGPPISASFTISATDSAGTVATGSPQTISATLSVAPPCLPVVPGPLAFSAVQGQASPAQQSVSLKEMNTCSLPINWTATGDSNSSTWLSLSSPPQDTSGGGSPLTVSVNSASLPAGTYKGTITVTATDGNGNAVGSSQSIAVTLTVTPPPTYTISGTVMSCAGPAPACPTPVPLPGASLTLLNSNNVQVATAIADGSGNYSFTNVQAGNYSVSVTGTDASNVHYSTTIPLVVTASVTNVLLDVFPG